MTFEMKTVVTKITPDVMNFDEWIDQQDSSILSDYPECAGKTPAQVVQEAMAQLQTFAINVISQKKDDTTHEFITVWDNKETFLQHGNPAYIVTNEFEFDPVTEQFALDSNGNKIPVVIKTAFGHIMELYNQEFYELIDSKSIIS